MQADEKQKYDFNKDLSRDAIMTRIIHGMNIPHSFLHEGECSVESVSLRETCQCCGRHARICIDMQVYCLLCADDMCCPEQKKAIRNLICRS